MLCVGAYEQACKLIFVFIFPLRARRLQRFAASASVLAWCLVSGALLILPCMQTQVLRGLLAHGSSLATSDPDDGPLVT